MGTLMLPVHFGRLTSPRRPLDGTHVTLPPDGDRSTLSQHVGPVFNKMTFRSDRKEKKKKKLSKKHTRSVVALLKDRERKSNNQFQSKFKINPASAVTETNARVSVHQEGVLDSFKSD